jgi:hypothetical protein
MVSRYAVRAPDVTGTKWDTVSVPENPLARTARAVASSALRRLLCFEIAGATTLRRGAGVPDDDECDDAIIQLSPS